MKRKLKRKPLIILISLVLVLVLGTIGLLSKGNKNYFEIKLNDEVIAYVEDKTNADQVLASVKDEVSDFFGKTAYFEESIKFDRVKKDKQELSEVDDIVKVILPQLNVFDKAKTVYLDDTKLVSVKNDVDVDAIIESITKSLTSSLDTGDETSLTQKIEVKEEDINVNEIFPEDILEYILNPLFTQPLDIKIPSTSEDGFIIKEVSIEELELINKQPLEVVSYKKLVEKKAIEYETEYEDDASLYTGETSVKQAGVNGEIEIEKKVKYINGEEVSEEIIKETTLKEAVKQIVLNGTKTRPVVTPNTSGGLAGKTIMIDPGHGGKDPGAVQNGVKEVELNDKLAAAVGSKLRALGANVLFTRQPHSNTSLELEERRDITNRSGADLFLSIHHDSGSSTNYGYGIYWSSYHPGLDTSNTYVKYQGSEFKWAEEFKGPNDISSSIVYIQNGKRVTRIIDDVYIYDKKYHSVASNSLRFSNNLINTISKTSTFSGIRPGAKDDNFFVTRWMNMPSVLLEAGFVSNPNIVKRLDSEAHRNEMSDAIAQAIANYFN